MNWTVLFFIGEALIISSIIIAIRRNRIYKNGKRMVGKIISINEEEIIDNFKETSIEKLYRAVIEFFNEDGELITFTSDYEENKDIFEIGDSIIVLYYNNGEESIYLDDKGDLFKLPVYIFVIGILFLSFSFTFYIL